MGCYPLVNDIVLYCISHSLEDLLRGCFVDGTTEHVFYIKNYCTFEQSLVKACIFHSLPPHFPICPLYRKHTHILTRTRLHALLICLTNK